MLSAMVTAPIFAQDKTKPYEFSVWLIPQQPELNYFQKMINKLAKEQQAPKFQPHITIYWGKTDSLENIKQIIKSLAQKNHPITLNVTGADATPEIFKTLFVIFADNDQLSNWSKQIGDATINKDYQLHLHLSLLYKDMPIEKKQALLKQVQLNLKRVTFDKLELIREDDPDVVSKWIPIFESRLHR